MTVGHTVCSFRIRRVEIYLCVAVAHMKHCEYKCIRESVGVCVWVCGRVCLTMRASARQVPSKSETSGNPLKKFVKQIKELPLLANNDNNCSVCMWVSICEKETHIHIYVSASVCECTKICRQQQIKINWKMFIKDFMIKMQKQAESRQKMWQKERQIERWTENKQCWENEN